MKIAERTKMAPKGRGEPNILAFDTALPHCAAAFLNDHIRYKITEPMKRGQAERLMPLLDSVLAHENGSWENLDLIAVGIGPGNFTGIRIAVSAARGLGLGLGIPVMGVSMFEVIRDPDGPMAHPSEIISLPAPRDQIYIQHFRYGAPTDAPMLLNPENLPTDLQFPINTRVIGVHAETLCLAGHASDWENAIVEDVAARIAIKADARWRQGETAPARPAPLYVKPADAAPPRDAAPVIIP